MQSDAVQIENKPLEYRFILLGALTIDYWFTHCDSNMLIDVSELGKRAIGQFRVHRRLQVGYNLSPFGIVTGLW